MQTTQSSDAAPENGAGQEIMKQVRRNRERKSHDWWVSRILEYEKNQDKYGSQKKFCEAHNLSSHSFAFHYRNLRAAREHGVGQQKEGQASTEKDCRKNRPYSWWCEKILEYEENREDYKNQSYFCQKNGLARGSFQLHYRKLRTEREQEKEKRLESVESWVCAPVTFFLPGESFIEFDALPPPKYLGTLIVEILEKVHK